MTEASALVIGHWELGHSEKTMDPSDLKLINHFSVLIYPFLHDIKDWNWQARMESLAPRWAPWWSRLTDEELAMALDDSCFFLPYIRGQLFPETARLQSEQLGEGYAGWSRILRSWLGKGLGAFSQELGPGSVHRLTCQAPLRAALGEFTLIQHREINGQVAEHEEVPARLDWLDALLFPSGIGFLMFKVRVREESPRLSKLIDLNSYLRTILPPNLSWTLPTLHFAGAAQPMRMANLVNLAVEGLASKRDGPLTDGVAELRSGAFSPTRPYTETEPGQAYGERCQTLAYACIHLSEADREKLPSGPFPTVEERILFEVGTCIGLGNTINSPMWAPAPEYAQRLAKENSMAVWRCWRAMGLRDSFVFLATEDLGFTRRSLPHNIENDYLPLYLYTLYQKFQLYVFSNDFMTEVAQVRRNLSGVRALMDRFVNFRNQFWFNEITRKPLGGELYHTMQQGLEVQGLYQLVTTSVKEARDYFQQLNDRLIQRTMMLVGLVFGPLAILFGALRVFLQGDTPPLVKGLLLTLIGSAAIVAFILWYRKRRPRRRTRRSG
jgi:hypothetical protein